MKKLFLLSSLFVIISSFAYTSKDFSNANFLADQQIVTKQTMASKYRLDDKILRQEVIGMALKVKGITLPENYTCKKYFADTTKNDWVCRAVELAADNGIITRNNKYANPTKFVTRSEALAMVIFAGGIQIYRSTTDDPIDNSAGYLFEDANAWQQDIIEQGLAREIISPVIQGGSLFFYPNRLSTRAEVFEFTKKTLNYISENPLTGASKTYSNDTISFQYSSRYYDSQSSSIKNVSLQEEGNKIDIGSYSNSGDVIVTIKYYKNINSDSAILNTLGYTESEGCQGPTIADKRTLPSGAVTFTAQFGKVMELCGINGAWKGLYFPNEGVLISIFLGQDGQFEVLSTDKNVDYEQITQKFMETFKIVSQ